MAGTLFTYGANVSGTAAFFAGFDTIAVSPADLTGPVQLSLSAAGALDLTAQLTGRSVTFTAAPSGSNAVTTSDGDDTIIGGVDADILNGGAGNDTLFGMGGADSLIGGGGIDTVSYETSAAAVRVDLIQLIGTGGDAEGDTYSGIENIIGSSLADTLIGSSAGNRIDAGDGDDVLAGRGGADELIGGDGSDTVSYGTSAAAVRVDLTLLAGTGGDAEGDTYSGIENIRGSVHADTLIGNSAKNRIEAGGGDDVLAGRGGADELIGGDGSDTVTYGTSATAVRVDLTLLIGTGGDASGNTYSSIENIRGSGHADTLIGSAGKNRLEGGSGDDLLAGRGGADELIGGEGNDTVSYGVSAAGVRADLTLLAGTGGDAAGDTYSSIENVRGTAQADTLIGSSTANRLEGNGGNDILVGRGGADILIGGTGKDTASYAGSAAGVMVSLLTGTGTGGDAEGDTLESIESLIGSDSADTLVARATGSDLDGGKGDDILVAGKGAATLIGGEGVDTADFSSLDKAITIDLVTGTATISGGIMLTLSGIENVIGGKAIDTIIASAAPNRIAGLGSAPGLSLGANVSYAASTAGVNVNLGTGIGSGGFAEGDVLSDIRNLVGSDWNDTITVGPGYGVFELGKGDDRITVLAPSFVSGLWLKGGEGVDTVDLSALTTGMTIDLKSTSSVQGFENLIGTQGNDTIRGTSADNILDGQGGDDYFTPDAGADTLIGGSGVDTIDYRFSQAGPVDVNLATGVAHGGAAEGDTLSGFENVFGTNGADRIVGNDSANRIEGGAGADELDGGKGQDTASYAGSQSGVTVSLTTGLGSGGDAEGDTLVRIERLQGSSFEDTLIGDSGYNRLEGGARDDILEGRGGADWLIGSTGKDTASYGSSAAGVTVNLATNVNTGGDAQGDTLSEIENLTGSTHDDTLTGNSVVNRLDGGLGADMLDGGLASDTLTGGGGPDTFAFTTAPGASNIDVITDMTVGSDLISLSTAIYSALEGGPTPGSLAASSFRLSTESSSSGGLGEIIYNATTGSLLYDADGSGAGAAKQFASVSAGLALSASSFRLA